MVAPLFEWVVSGFGIEIHQLGPRLDMNFHFPFSSLCAARGRNKMSWAYCCWQSNEKKVLAAELFRFFDISGQSCRACNAQAARGFDYISSCRTPLLSDDR
jgi:hypothetical protein